MTISGGDGFGGDLDKSRRTLGHGANYACCGDIATKMLSDFQQNISDMPVCVQSRTMFTGPVPDPAIDQLFAPQMNLIEFGKNVPGATETSLTGLSNGQASTHLMICGVFAHLTPPPFNFTVPGNAFSASGPALPTASRMATSGSPVSPDEFTSEDTGAAGNLGLLSGESLTQAYLDYGNWVQEGFYELARAYNWMWTNGEQTVLLNWPLRHIAKVIPSPQSDTSAQGAIATARYVRQANDYYRNGGNSPNGGLTPAQAIFLTQNARRTGSGLMGPGPGPVVGSMFEPDSSANFVEPTYGGPGVQELGCNTEYFRLPMPVIFPRSVSLNMFFQAVSGTAQSRVKHAFSMTDGLGGTPPGVIQQDSSIVAGDFSGTGTTPVFSSYTADTPPTPNAVKVPAGMACFKIGDWWMTVGLVGYELNDPQWDMIKAARGDLTSVFANAGQKIHYWGC